MNPDLLLSVEVSLGEAWAANSVNCTPYRVSGLVTAGTNRLVAFYDAAGDVKVWRQGLGSDGDRAHFTIPNKRKPFDAHQAISVGVDAKGRTHVAFGAHSSPLLICRSKTACLEDGFTAPEEAGLSTATYPMFVRWKGALFLLYRDGFHDCGSLHVAFLNEHDRWQARPTPLMTGTDAIWSSGPYINTPVVSDDGRLHFFIVWRLSGNSTSAGQVVNVGLDYVCSDDGLETLHTLNGIRLTQPITPSTSERVVCVPIGSSLINQSTACVLSGNRPAALTYWAGRDGIPQYRLCWHDHRQWRIATVSQFRTKFRLEGRGTLPLPHSRPEIAVDGADRVTILYRTEEHGNRLVATTLFPPDYSLIVSQQQVLVDEDLGYYEPVIDRRSWHERGELAIFVQRCQQQRDSDGAVDFGTAQARLQVWRAPAA